MRFTPYIVILGLGWASIGCQISETSTTTTVVTNGLPDGPPEKAYCPYFPPRTNFGGAATVTVTGSAGFKYRMNAPGQGGVVSPTTKPIRFAEVRVTDGGGNVVQCAETDVSGNYSVVVPANQSYHVVVASRGLNSHVQASVLDGPATNGVFEVGTDFTVAAANKAVAQIVAQADQKIDAKISGGAFNIFDDIYQANAWLNSQTAGCNNSGSPHFVALDCQPFSVAPKITAYFSAGFNPGSYFPDTASAPISFYLQGQGILMILGGLNGDVNNSDTDQFDDSIIIHEYGHFIEDVFAKTNSPGGSHDGRHMIDPRLAWGEGWANFFQAAVTGQPFYRDTQGTSDGHFGYYFNEDLSKQTPGGDVPTTADEGIYREFSISRTLWAVIAPHPVSGVISQETNVAPGVHAPFAELWYLFTDPTHGFRSSNFHFRNMGLWLTNQLSLRTSSGNIALGDLTQIRADEKQDASLSQYSIPIRGGACATTNTLTVGPDQFVLGFPQGSFATSNLARSNHFYELDHGGGPMAIHLNWSATAPNLTDLDLYLYNEVYTYGDNSTMVGFSNQRGTCASNCSEDINIGYLPPGVYLINVMAFTGDSPGSTTPYTLKINGAQVCP